MNYTNHLNDKQNFIDAVKQSMDNRAMEKIEAMKKEIANSVLKSGE